MAEIDIRRLNEIAKEPLEVISRADAEYKAFVASLADRVVSSDEIRIVLLSGPSGSGKTTTANMLSDAIKSRGFECLVVSLDDYYRNKTDPVYPRLPNGERDFERPEALDIPCLLETLSDIAEGREFSVPRYDFLISARETVIKYPKIQHGCVVIEGLHALNPMISSSLPKERLLKVFISVSTNVLDGGERILSGRKLRFVRRMVRDNIYRGASAEETLRFWANVLDGEDKYLYPFRDLADVTYNTFHEYEVGVMKSFALPLLAEALAKSSPYIKTVREAMLRADSIDERLVPDHSLIREFIPGGMYDHLY